MRVRSNARKLCENCDDKYMSITTTPIARNMIMTLRHVLSGTTESPNTIVWRYHVHKNQNYLHNTTNPNAFKFQSDSQFLINGLYYRFVSK